MVTRVTAVAAHVTVEAVVLVATSDIESVIERLQQCQLAGATVTMQTLKPPSRQSQAVANAQAERAVAAHGLLQATPTVGALAQPAPELQIAPARSASPCVGDAASQIYSVFRDPSRKLAPNATREVSRGVRNPRRRFAVTNDSAYSAASSTSFDHTIITPTN